ncbi:MAG TPA: hypothetical protein VL475_03920 [Planctomycetaceae bacterium]|nr:hypothetical protein [Planctomycetaceae bacterium]
MRDPTPSRNIFFPLTIAFSSLFIVTILALVAVLFGDPHAPAALLLDRCASWLLGVEVAGILTAGLAALVVDRRQTLAAERTAALPGPQSEGSHEQEQAGGN